MILKRPSKPFLGLTICGLLLATCFIGMSVLSSCDDGCEQIRENYLIADFTSTSGRTLTSMSYIAKSGDKQTEVQKEKTFTGVEFDLNPNANATQLLFTFTYSDYGDQFTVTDSVNIEYTVDTKFLDMSCGCTVIYNITNVSWSDNLLNGMNLNAPQVLTESGTNITFTY